MPVNYAAIAIGKCFAMPNNDVRQVVGMDRGASRTSCEGSWHSHPGILLRG